MTREEAIKHLEEWRECISSAYRRQVIDMAIEALAERPTESDFISKAEVLETYSELYWFDSDCEVISKAEVDKIYERLQSLPSADRPTGEWTDNHNGTFTCDQCGCKHSKSNYCPNCGARMYKGGEDE